MRNVVAIAKVVLLEMYRRKDFYVLFIVTVLITAVMGSVTFFHDPNIVQYLKDLCLFLILASSLFIAIGATARQIPAERESRTIFPLMAKPVSRAEILAGKFLGCWLACGVALLLFYIFFSCVAVSREHSLPLAQYFQAATLQWAMLALVVGMTLLGSLVFTAVSSNVTISFIAVVFILLVGRHLHQVAVHMNAASGTFITGLYFVLPHLELFDVRDLIVHDWPIIPWGYWLGALVYAAVYSALLLTASWLLFRRKVLQ
ncbi:MAG TPA: ABC transporter permease [Verrucomicrobiae bacterium]|jgi:ABC-type transport system involved in multi-copper enzyme maturation permease subunit|nr:ABC transporter permease [Verrucomicrobiae bacterium]